MPDASSPRSLRILIVDDHALLVKGETNLLEHRGLQVVGATADGREGLEQALRLAPDLMLMDIIMPAMNSLDITRLIKENGGQVIAYADKLGLYLE